MRLSDLCKCCMPYLPFLALLLDACQATQMQKEATEDNLMENFHRGISYKEVKKRSDAYDITGLVCYKGRYILNDSGRTAFCRLRPLNMLVEGHGKAIDTNSYVVKLDLGSFDSTKSEILYTRLDGSLKLYMEEFENNLEENILYRADTLKDRGYRDKIISPHEIREIKGKIIKEDYEGKFTYEGFSPK